MTHRFAIIGAGAAGSFTARRLRQHFPDAEIVVFEREQQVGGRAATVTFCGEQVEVGGTLLHSSNRRIVELAAELGLEYSPPGVALGDMDASVTVWDGQRFVFRASTKGMAFLFSLVRRYGLFNLRRLRAAAGETIAKWNSIYDKQDAGVVFESVGDVVEALELGVETKVSLREFARSRKISERVVDEIGAGILRNMYNQTPDISSLAGMVGLAGAGFAGGSLFSIERGNAAVFAGALERADAEVRLGETVVGVSNTLELTTETGATEAFDAVVLAAPVELAGVALPATPTTTDEGYQRVHVTLVAGLVNGSYFGVPEAPGTIFTTPSAPFKSFGRVGFSESEQLPIYKFFSETELGDGFLSQVFGSILDVHRLSWLAYPKMAVNPSLHSFNLAPGVYTTNVQEAICSTLETEAVAGWSVADLVARDFGGRAAAAS